MSPAEALNRIRLATVGKGILFAMPGVEVDDGIYYRYRTDLIFSALADPKLSAACSGAPEALVEQVRSLGQRVEFLLRAADSISFQTHRRATNESEHKILYHLGYFIMLAIGIFDDLAWIITFRYGLKLPNGSELPKVKTTLRISPGNPGPFYDALQQSDPGLCSFLMDAQTQQRIRMLYPVRDRLQHRRFITGGMYQEMPMPPRILVGLDLEAFADLPADSYVGPPLQFGQGLSLDERWVDPYWFERVVVDSVADVVNSTMRRIDWSPFLAHNPAQDRATGGGAPGPESAGWALDLPAEPVYFGAR